MGLLSEGHPLSWAETHQYADHVRQHGIAQFIALYHRLKTRTNDVLRWGDEIEYTLIKLDHEKKEARVSLRAKDLLERLQADELAGKKDLKSLWRPEYASYVIEGTPGIPYAGHIGQFNDVEKSMKYRREEVTRLLQKDEMIVSLTAFPRLGCNPFTVPDTRPDPEHSFSRSLFWPSEATYLEHPRFKTLSSNIRQRRGEKVAINVPVYPDKHTPPADAYLDDLSSYDEASRRAAKPGHIYMDAMGFGMGLSCMQVTFQACNLAEAEMLYDQLAPLCPIFLALSAASPVFRGYLADVDCRWDVIAASVDCRTRGERGEAPLKEGERRIPKSRYDSISSYLSECSDKFDYNDVPLVYDEDIYRKLLDNGINELMAKHMAHLFIRDTVSLFSEKVHQDDSRDTDHFENIQSTNWQTMRFKPPPPDSPIGWRVEFRPCDLQITDFENAAVLCFVVLLTRAILSFNYNLLVPVSKVDANMARAQRRDAVLGQKFFFRTNVTAACREKSEAAAPVVEEMTLDQIFNGDAALGFPGLIPLVTEYLRDMEVDAATMCTLTNYCRLISQRASGQLKTNARWMRDFVLGHEEYKGDSRVTERIQYDLLMEIDRVQRGEKQPAELLGDLRLHTRA